MNLRKLGILIIVGVFLIASIVLFKKYSENNSKTLGIQAPPNTQDAQIAQIPKVEEIMPQDAYELVYKDKQDQNFVTIDVRTPEEYASGHIGNALNLDYQSPAFKNELEKLDKNKIYLVYCRSGNRSTKAVQIMQELGFGKIYNLFSGINGWTAESFPIEH